MFHLIIRFLQIVIPTNFNDIIPWLITPVVLGGIASYAIKVFGSPRPDPKNPGGVIPGWTDQQVLLARLVTYLIIAILDIILQLIPASIVAEFTVPITTILAVLAAFFGQTAVSVYRGTSTVLSYIGYRIAFGTQGALRHYEATHLDKLHTDS